MPVSVGEGEIPPGRGRVRGLPRSARPVVSARSAPQRVLSVRAELETLETLKTPAFQERLTWLTALQALGPGRGGAGPKSLR